jgi:hypothetical protein
MTRTSNPFGSGASATRQAALFKAGRPFQGIRGIPGTKKCVFVELTKIPKDRNITYGKIVCDYKPRKKEKNVRLTVGGDRLDYSGDVATYTAAITTFKI